MLTSSHYVIVMSIFISFSNLGLGLTSGLLAETVQTECLFWLPVAVNVIGLPMFININTFSAE